MSDCSVQSILINRLAAGLGTEAARAFVARTEASADRPDVVAHVAALLDELEATSAKVARAAVDALPELDRQGGLSVIVPWLDMGVVLAQSSGAAALRYFKESPMILGLLERTETRGEALTVGIEAADRDVTAALEFLRVAPDLERTIPFGDARRWLDVGLELAAVDSVAGIEYVRQMARVAAVLRIEDVRPWLSVGTHLVTTNTLGKPDYLAMIEFMRTSPTVLGEIEQPAVRSQSLRVASSLAERSPESAVAWLAEAPHLLRMLPSEEQRLELLQYAVLLAERDAEAALLYLRRGPDVMTLIGEGPQARSRFETWLKAGMDVLAYSREGGRVYFGMESRNALASLERAMAGVPLRRVARRIKLFVQGLCGTDVTIATLPESASAADARATVSPDGRTMFLPAILRRYATAEENERWAMVMAAHEAGHLQFGTYRLRLAALADVIEEVRQRYGRLSRPVPGTLNALFQLYPLPKLAQDLWTVVEDARVEFLLQTEYPGLRHDLALLAAEAVASRRSDQTTTVTELMVDGLLRLSTGESPDSAVPRAIEREVSELWALCRPLFRKGATAEDAVRLTDALYVKIEELAASHSKRLGDDAWKDRTADESQTAPPPSVVSEQPTDMYRPLINHAHRGEMNPEFITWDGEPTRQDDEQDAERSGTTGTDKEGSFSGRSDTVSGGKREGRESDASDKPAGGQRMPAAVEELLSVDVEQRLKPESAVSAERTVRYPEWDYSIQDYRVNRCRIIERPADAGSDDGVETILASRRSEIASLRKLFESLHPVAYRRVPGQPEGDDPDLDAVVRRAAELRAGLEGSDRVYIRRDKRDRSVAAAFLVDISGSTSRKLDGGRRVIDIEKESLVLLCEALEAVGDQYGLYAYSGEGAASVDFFIVKDFDDRLGTVAAHRLGGLGPRRQNRDGAAIRHASAKLLKRSAKHRLLILLSDGRPLDGEDYKDDYAVEDTKKALQEARRHGIRPFCVTIDQETTEYQRRMYGDVRFVVIDRVESLPTRLPNVYRRLTA
ncbi:MAG: VWA domain-containing protein [Nitrospira sp.]|nr:VWA domain-containing protein [Nitrospira sp.]